MNLAMGGACHGADELGFVDHLRDTDNALP